MRAYPKIGISAPKILLPNSRINFPKWAVIACDQHTSNIDYWYEVDKFVGSQPSTYNLILPEAYLNTEKEAVHKKAVFNHMDEYLTDDVFRAIEGFIYIEREVGDSFRRGLVAALDLEQYDFSRHSSSLIRATEGTIIDRLPPRIQIREKAPLELPHILVLIDDPEDEIFSLLSENREDLPKLYDFDLMQSGGRIQGFHVEKANLEKQIIDVFRHLKDPLVQKAKYNLSDPISPLLFAIGDGNHSLATAKSIWVSIKDHSDPAHPARYAMVEIVNIHDPAIQFEPIHRIISNFEPNSKNDFINQISNRFPAQWDVDFSTMKRAILNVKNRKQIFGLASSDMTGILEINLPPHTLTVGSLQNYLDEYIGDHPQLTLDYIHGNQSLKTISEKGDTIGFFLPAMSKGSLFESVIKDGPLLRKTFSMGHANEKRYYLEARKIV